jgi:hypothetical protein
MKTSLFRLALFALIFFAPAAHADCWANMFSQETNPAKREKGCKYLSVDHLIDEHSMTVRNAPASCKRGELVMRQNGMPACALGLEEPSR